MIFVSASHQTGLDTRSNYPKVDFSGGLGEGKVGHEPRLGPCWSSNPLVQRGPDEPSWSWTQIWVQVIMLDYSLNWTVRSSAIQGGQRCQSCSSPTQRWPNRSWRPFDLESLISIPVRRECQTAQLKKAASKTKTVLFPTSQFRTSHLFAHSLDVKQFDWNRTLSGANTPGQSGPGSVANEGVLSPKLHHYWCLFIRLFSVVSRALVRVEESFPSIYFTTRADWVVYIMCVCIYIYLYNVWVGVSIYVYICMYIYCIYICVFVYIYICVCVYLYVYVSIYMRVYIMCVYMYVYICVHNVCVYIYVCIYYMSMYANIYNVFV